MAFPIGLAALHHPETRLAEPGQLVFQVEAHKSPREAGAQPAHQGQVVFAPHLLGDEKAVFLQHPADL